MSSLQLTKTKMTQGVWQGIITGSGSEKPAIEVTHLEKQVEGIVLSHNQSADHWTLSVPIPPEAIADGVHTLIIRDVPGDVKLGHITLLAGDVLGDDILAEMDLLRSELDMLKRAFRRHCVETA